MTLHDAALFFAGACGVLSALCLGEGVRRWKAGRKRTMSTEMSHA